MTVETSFSVATVVCGLKRIFHRLEPFIQARLASMVAVFHVLLTLFHQVHPDADPGTMSIAAFSLSNEHHWLLYPAQKSIPPLCLPDG